MSYGIVAQFVERKNKLYAYEVRGFDGGSFQTMIKENANNYRGLRQVKNPDEPTDGSFVGCYYEPKMETAVMFKDDDQTNAGLAILTTFTFVTNDDLTFLQETNKFYVFTVNKPFVDGDKTYILNGQAIRMTKQSGDVDLRSQGLPTNRNYSGEM
ncbi:MAG: hypothetical protein LBD41_08140 [Clostridiales Family XIII bacterium]|jgi:hypothetical protein|nr:hypothetical protein [Clostridiales Family XIII bacterium]